MNTNLEKDSKIFEFKGYKNCYLSVVHYPNEKAMRIGVVEKLRKTIRYDDGTAEIVKADVCSIDLYKLSEYTKDWEY